MVFKKWVLGIFNFNSERQALPNEYKMGDIYILIRHNKNVEYSKSDQYSSNAWMNI